jgi:hypothetical protein
VSGPVTHAEWMSRHGIDAVPGRSRFRVLRERIADLERLAERADSQGRERDAERRRREVARLYEELELFAEPVEAALCLRCFRPLTNAERYASPTCATCADPDLTNDLNGG